ncbi:MAG: multicopper oxidase domain-containing protein [Lentisphaeria bacterium]|nr:multicopper oxidase domain-containing protein [Lentisphaeria bacterium]
MLASTSLKGLAETEKTDKHAGHDMSNMGDMDMKPDMAVVGECTSGTLDPDLFLTHFDWGKQTKLPDGSTRREYDFVTYDKEIEIAPGVFFPAWAYTSLTPHDKEGNPIEGPGGVTGHVPGPTIRCVEGDTIVINYTNQSDHPHTLHFHGFHHADMDGSMKDQFVYKNGTFKYEFTAEPFGLHLYHCHSVPLKRHIHKGLYGTYIVDPKEGVTPAKEFVMVMNGFDTNFDGGNEVYALNSVAHHHMRHPIVVKKDEPIRLYVVNVTEFDPINSFHLHANFFYENRTGTSKKAEYFTDTIMLCQGERSVLELTFPRLGMYMFHAHQSEFAELGWMGNFLVVE